MPVDFIWEDSRCLLVIRASGHAARADYQAVLDCVERNAPDPVFQKALVVRGDETTDYDRMESRDFGMAMATMLKGKSFQLAVVNTANHFDSRIISSTLFVSGVKVGFFDRESDARTWLRANAA